MSATRAKILVVDDQPNNLLAAEAMLADLGQEVVKARSGFEALRRLLEEDYAVILLDVMMPEMDGPATVDGLRSASSTAGIPVILLTAKVQASDRSRLDGLEVSGLIAKPFDPVTLPQLVSDVLGWPS